MKLNAIISFWWAGAVMVLVTGPVPGCSNDKTGGGDMTTDGGAGGDTGQPRDTTPEQVTSWGLLCNPGYTCTQSAAGEVVWVMKNDGNVNGPTCKDVCEKALDQNCAYYACDDGRAVEFPDMASFEPLAKELGFDCRAVGCDWSDAPAEGLYVVSINTDEATGQKACMMPSEATLRCDTHIGNANCFGERYAQVCPCVSKPLDKACTWDCGPQHTTLATWKTGGDSCVERINYWRKRACEEGWVECPPAGLPPMVECTACHECANAEAAWDKANGAHNSFGRCGEHVQGEGGGATCADVIDSFVAERAPDENGVMRCQGHCGPIVAPGCQTFFWGKDRDTGFHVLNWRSCNVEKCQGYCADNPDDCYTVESSPDGTCDDPAVDAEPGPTMTCPQN